MSHPFRVYGHIPNFPFGTKFRDRSALMRSGVHAPSQAGIHGDAKEGAFSICISGGYEDNQDSGDKIIYVGSGGQDTKTRQQIADQSFDDPPNQSLLVSSKTRRPVRVVRGTSKSNYYSPATGYRYDGLYVVDSVGTIITSGYHFLILVQAREGVGKEGFKMCFFELRRIIEEGDGPIPARRLLTGKRLSNMLRRVRNN
ncbi:putative E3 ubiquitin-protein ligase UHRF1 [Lanmaoa asiatica]|nr:putative E3 ubiquitin-protein ligase UHRF1 [Lanmaoa asiatica]